MDVILLKIGGVGPLGAAWLNVREVSSLAPDGPRTVVTMTNGTVFVANESAEDLIARLAKALNGGGRG